MLKSDNIFGKYADLMQKKCVGNDLSNTGHFQVFAFNELLNGETLPIDENGSNGLSLKTLSNCLHQFTPYNFCEELAAEITPRTKIHRNLFGRNRTGIIEFKKKRA